MNKTQVTRPVFPSPLLHLCPRNLPLSLVTIFPCPPLSLGTSWRCLFTARPFVLSPIPPAPCSSRSSVQLVSITPQPELLLPLWPADHRCPVLPQPPVFWAVTERGSGPHHGWTGGLGCGGLGARAAAQVRTAFPRHSPGGPGSA